MIRLPLLSSILLGAFFWRQTGTCPPPWPNDIPTFEAHVVQVVTLKNGSAHLAAKTPEDTALTLSRIRAAYHKADWCESPVTAALPDFALFTKDAAVAAVQVRSTNAGSFITLLQKRPSM